MKKFKHKQLGWVAEQDKEYKAYFSVTLHNITIIPRLPIEYLTHSQDREEVVEKDRVDNIIETLQLNKAFLVQYREIIEKNTPKVKKVTDEQVRDFVREYSDPNTEQTIRGTLEKFLGMHGLL